MRFLYALLFCGLLAPGAYAQTSEPVPLSTPAPVPDAKSKKDKPSFLPFPIVFSQPETVVVDREFVVEA